MTRRTFDPDRIRRDNAPYWGAALVLALQAGDKERIGKARRNLKRLGFIVGLTVKGVRRGK